MIAINKVSIEILNLDFIFNDVVPYGVDYSHLKLKRINLELANFNSGAEDNDVIDQLSFQKGRVLIDSHLQPFFLDRAILLDTFRVASPNTNGCGQLALTYDALAI